MKRKKIYVIALIAAIFVFLFGCFNYNVQKDIGMEDKVHAALILAMDYAQQDPEMPRTKFLGNSKNMPHYRAKLNDRPDLVLRQLLVAANANAEIPPLKIRNFYITAFTSAHVTVYVTYAGAFGLKRKKTFDYTLPLVAFKHETGSDAFTTSTDKN